MFKIVYIHILLSSSFKCFSRCFLTTYVQLYQSTCSDSKLANIKIITIIAEQILILTILGQRLIINKSIIIELQAHVGYLNKYIECLLYIDHIIHTSFHEMCTFDVVLICQFHWTLDYTLLWNYCVCLTFDRQHVKESVVIKESDVIQTKP